MYIIYLTLQSVNIKTKLKLSSALTIIQKIKDILTKNVE